MTPNYMLLIASTVLLSGATPSPAQVWPSRPIRIIVPQPPGGSTDVIARVVSQRMGEALGQPVIIDNRPGAGTIVGVEIVAQNTKHETKGSVLGCGMAMSHVPAGESPAQITASHGSGIEPCRFTGNGGLDA